MTTVLSIIFGGWRGAIWLILIVIALALAPFAFATNSYTLYLLFTVFLFAVFGHGWNLLAGFCGLLSFGTQVYIGISGFALGIFTYYAGINVWVGMVLAGAIAGLFAFLLAVPIKERFAGARVWRPIAVAVAVWVLYEVVIWLNPDLNIVEQAYVRRVMVLLLIFLGALPLLRLQGAYFAVATWLIAEAVGAVFNEWSYTGAGGGMQIVSQATIPQLYWISLGLLVVATLVIWRLLRSKYGLALTAVRDSEEAASSVGIDIRWVKMLVFVLSGVLIGLGGCLFYIDAVIITPPSAFTITWSAYFVFIVVAGGMGTLAGPIIGAIIFVAADRIIGAYFEAGLLVIGALSILLILFLPRGIMGIVDDIRHGETGGDREPPVMRAARIVLGLKPSRARRTPGVVGAFLVSGNPLPLMHRENAPYRPLVEGYEKAKKAIAEADPDAIIIYSTQWVAVLDQLWQAKPRLVGLHVDENWHEHGNLRFDIKVDRELALACVEATRMAGIQAKAIDYDGFPIDTGTIVASSFLNPAGSVPSVICANNIYHDWETTRRLGELAVAKAVDQGKRVVVIGVGGLSAAMFRGDIDLAEDHFVNDGDDAWNRELLANLERGDQTAVGDLLPIYAKEAGADMGMKHLAFILGALGDNYSRAVVHGYAPVYGSGQAVVEFRV
jgi:ABC-type branched-subunit amino acid transport system permease subunit/aromatic ring-opening dioxygenase catalytic subunit (LigB family)